ncbi:coenzyme F420-0:L-glutamate ligase [Litorilinea aerophila]|uniref:Putative folate metabolism gamma-glutamate ligase n=1 Tax=Litorilinea aerophila TaxID=1204385 RepID=A0A540VIY3_9CHLR|nr:coenzyme F420-0:L-glutamate ligase [Litorilinea aerophila]MCC9075579.1 coenzyme F420-0:L-glutamate ligase [Litorilinea aerophila]OUC06183.1 hypothetical protein RY27_22620 [Litorilinea aerophila]GIV79218.1 MAG: hypothetical protein KatS3mg050_3612 [Litorilinea sp.]
MHIQPIRTRPITAQDRDLLAILDEHVPALEEREILAVTSKIVALCQGRAVPMAEADGAQLVQQEADLFLPPGPGRHPVYLTIKGNTLMPGAGVDESNTGGYLVPWPQAPQETANQLRAYLQQRFGRRRVGVLITDSRPLPLRWGVTGFAVAHSGFLALRDYRGRGDLFGRPLRMTQANVADALAAAAVLVMGEGDEQTPLARIRDLPFVTFQERDPTPEELAALTIDPADDLYAPLLTAVPWQRGQGGSR